MYIEWLTEKVYKIIDEVLNNDVEEIQETLICGYAADGDDRNKNLENLSS